MNKITVRALATSVGPLIKGQGQNDPDRRLLCFDVIDDNGICDRRSAYLTGNAAHKCLIRFGEELIIIYHNTRFGWEIVSML